MNKITRIIIIGTLIYTAVMLIYDSAEVINTTIKSISVCLNSIIPSMYGYMVLTDFLIKSNYGQIIFYPIYKIMRKFLYIDLNTFTIFLLSQIGGYPVGAKMSAALISQNKNYSEVYDRFAGILYASGPSFICGVIGIGIYNDIKCGIYIFISCFIANLILFIIECKKNNKIKIDEIKPTSNISAKICSDSVLSSTKAMLIVCSFLIIFNTFFEILSYFIKYENNIMYAIKAIIEISNIKSVSKNFPLYLCAFLCSLGGICVIFQIFTISKDNINLKRFLMQRIIAAVISLIICFILTFNYNYSLEYKDVLNSLYIPHYESGNPVIMVCLIVMTIFVMNLLADLPKKQKN